VLEFLGVTIMEKNGGWCGVWSRVRHWISSARRASILGCAVWTWWIAAPGLAAETEPAPTDDGFHLDPHLGFRRGDHNVDLELELRYRWEDWKAFNPDWDDFHGVRSRFALDYRYKDVFRLFAQGQQMASLGLTSDASGAGANYRTNNGNDQDPHGVRPSQLFAEASPTESSWIRFGRSYIDQGTLVTHSDANWSFLAGARLSQRLVGSVGWTTAARSNDGLSAFFDWEGHAFHAFAAQPTTGVFVIDSDAYKRQKSITFGGIHWTAKRGTLVDDSQIEAFFIAYEDDRNPDKVAGLFGDIEVYTLGASWLGVYPCGPGRVDLLLWGALQVGDYKDQNTLGEVKQLDQLAGGLIAEAGYQLHEVWSKPWLRFGVNWASGDDSPNDGSRNTFFNLLPTNHMYYGYVDQLAFSNLIDLLVQLKLNPIGKLGIELTYHRFWLQEDNDFRWLGTGAFSKKSLGYVRNGNAGSRDIGHELDLTLAYPVGHGIKVMAGFSKLWGGDAFDGQAQKNASYGFLQIQFNH
jgi:hypothetical protein